MKRFIDIASMGNRLVELRKEHGYSQVFVAGKIGVTQGTICNWERGVHGITVEHILSLVKLYNTTADYILQGVVNGDRNTVRDLMRTRKPVEEPEVSDEELMSIMFGGGTKYDY